jgi:virulence factor Mce-like protein
MMVRNRLAVGTGVALVGLLVAATAVLVHATLFRPKTIIAYFSTTTAIYPDDGVRVSGVKVGTIVSIDPVGTQTKLTMTVDRNVPIPADAKAVIVAQNLISARYVQLTPAYRSSGPVMADGAAIPADRTAVPVEWDEVKQQLTRLANALGPSGATTSSTSVGRFIDSAANALGDNGDKLRQTLAQLSGVGRILANGSGDIVETLKNLQTFVTALSGSTEQIVQFEHRLATLTSVLDGSTSELDAALTNLSEAVGDVQGFLAESRDKTSEQVARLANVTQNLVDHRGDVEQILHLAPNAIANTYSSLDPQIKAPAGTFVFNNLSDPVGFFCTTISAMANVTAPETGRLCKQYFGPALRSLNANSIPIPFAPILTRTPPPEDLIYSEPKLAPGGAGADPPAPEMPPWVSAYAGLPGGTTQGTDWPLPVIAPPGTTSLPDILLPAEQPPPPNAPADQPPGEPQAGEGTP